ncbi:MAG: hypothetical protein M5U27_10925 [Gaiella sp.]|nr:hypothetical protein [Gaiella sp.]
MNAAIAFVRSNADGAVEVVVNFGPLSGREATLAEVDRLARRLLATAAARVRVDAVRTHDMSPDTETIVHQVVVEADAPATEARALRDVCEAWAIDCADERSLEPLGL